MKKAIGPLLLITVFVCGAIGASERVAPPPAVANATASTGTNAQGASSGRVSNEVPHNILDLRRAVFRCNDSGCIVSIANMNVIACAPDGCKTLTDIMISSGTIARRQ